MASELSWVVVALIVFGASFISIKVAVSTAIIELALGVIAGNLLHMNNMAWLDFLAVFGGILLTFLAGAEVDISLMKKRLKETMLIGMGSFLAPFLAAFAYTRFLAGWSLQAAGIAGIALSTTSLAVVYAVLVETGLTETETGKVIMAACFVTDLGTALGLSIIFAGLNIYTLLFVLGSAGMIFFSCKLLPKFFVEYSGKVIEPEIKLLFLILFAFILVAKLGAGHAVLPVFIFGLALSSVFRENRVLQRKLRTIAFAMITPYFFIKGGLNVSLKEVYMNLGLLGVLFLIKVIPKFVAVYPLARKCMPRESVFSTLLMSTGLTFGTISSLYGLTAGYINQSQFSLLVAVVVLSAIIPTYVAQRWFEPRHLLSAETEPSSLQEVSTNV